MDLTGRKMDTREQVIKWLNDNVPQLTEGGDLTKKSNLKAEIYE